MFKNVEYSGFEGHPDWLLLAERGTALLRDEIRSMWESVTVGWGVRNGPAAALAVTTTLDLPIGIGRGARVIPVAEFTDEGLVRSRLRAAWDQTLGNLLEKRKPVWDELLREPVGI